jgi:large subunit ribosomal protein L3
MEGLIGKKLGMTQVFDAKGARVPVTVIAAGPCVVVQRKTLTRDGYEAVQLGFGEQRRRRVTKPALGRFRKANTAPKRVLAEFAVQGGDELKEGDTVSLSLFEGTSHVDVTGVSKGQGFQGVVKRHGMRGGPQTHGGHSKRRVGSIGQNAFPARVNKGKRMPGHSGHVRVTQQNLRVVELRMEDHMLLVEGAVPGPTGGVVLVRKALKKKSEKSG